MFGIVLLDKPLGMSSNHALQRVKRLLGASKAGHVGSLDPLATGMLPICLNEATKIAGDILSGRKHYRFTISLGTRTATGDAEGAVVESCEVPPLDRAKVEQVLQTFIGRQQQVPPMYSALKKDGQPLYKLARQGIEVERAAREIDLFELTLTGLKPAALELDVRCSKGTYVRTLAEDIARKLGTCGHVAQLRRVSVEPFEGESMETLESIEQAVREARVPRIIPADRAVSHLPAARLTEEAASRLMQGQAVSLGNERAAGRVRIYDERGRFLGIGEANEQGEVQPRRLFSLVTQGVTE